MLFVVSLLGITMTFMIYQFYSVIDVRSLNISLDVAKGSGIGMSADIDKLDFGAVPNGGTVEKGTLVENYREEPVKILIIVKGNVSPFIEVSENNFVLASNESKHVKIIARPINAETGYYSGIALFYFKRV